MFETTTEDSGASLVGVAFVKYVGGREGGFCYWNCITGIPHFLALHS